MSITSIRAALETALATIAPALSTSYENAPFTPPANTVPYQECVVHWAQPDNLELTTHIHLERGVFQINLYYPTGRSATGSKAAADRAELIRATFYHGATFSAGGLVVRVSATPEITPGGVQGDRYVLSVRIRFFAQVTRS